MEIGTDLKQIIEWVGQGLDVFGVAIIAIGMAYGALQYALELVRGKAGDGYAAFRLYLVRALLDVDAEVRFVASGTAANAISEALAAAVRASA